MKGEISSYRGKELLILILMVVASTTFLIWRWDRTSFFSAFPPREVKLQFSQETLLENVSKKDVIMEVGKHGRTETEVNCESNAEATNPNCITASDAKDNEVVELEKSSNRVNFDASKENDNQTIHKNDPKQNMLISDNHTVLVKDQTCNYVKGKWVIDNGGPLYSGFKCKRWLSQMWACRIMKRTDFSYEKLRWKPNDCEMEAFEGPKFLQRMRDKTLAFVGDSLGRQQFQSLMCMVTGGKDIPDVIDVGSEYGLVKRNSDSRPKGWAYRFRTSNTTILYYWSSCLCHLDPIDPKNPSTKYAMHLDRPPQFLRQFLPKVHVLVLNTGHHWNRGKIQANRWVMYIGGQPNRNKNLERMGDAKNFTIHSIVSWVNEQLPKNPHLKAFYRTISPRHFVNGEWNTGGSCDNTVPMSVGKEIPGDESSDFSARSAVKGTGVGLLDITGLSGVRDEGHISRFSVSASRGVHDCLHWCLPGVPDTWNEILFAHISDVSRKWNE